MQDFQKQTKQDVFAFLKEIRHQLKAWQEQQEAIEQRLQVFRQRQYDLQAQLDFLQREQEYHMMLRQEQERKQAEWLKRKTWSMEGIIKTASDT